MNKANQVDQRNQRNQTHDTGQLFRTLLKWQVTDGTVLPGFQISEKLFINIEGLNDTRRRVVRGVFPCTKRLACRRRTGKNRDVFSILGVGFFLRPLVGLQLDLLDEVPEVGPFCRSDHLKLKAEFPPPAPTDNGRLNLDWGFVLSRLDPDLQRGSWLNIAGAFDTTTSYGEIDDTALTADYAD